MQIDTQDGQLGQIEDDIAGLQIIIDTAPAQLAAFDLQIGDLQAVITDIDNALAQEGYGPVDQALRNLQDDIDVVGDTLGSLIGQLGQTSWQDIQTNIDSTNAMIADIQAVIDILEPLDDVTITDLDLGLRASAQYSHLLSPSFNNMLNNLGDRLYSEIITDLNIAQQQVTDYSNALSAVQTLNIMTGGYSEIDSAVRGLSSYFDVLSGALVGEVKDVVGPAHGTLQNQFNAITNQINQYNLAIAQLNNINGITDFEVVDGELRNLDLTSGLYSQNMIDFVGSLGRVSLATLGQIATDFGTQLNQMPQSINIVNGLVEEPDLAVVDAGLRALQQYSAVLSATFNTYLATLGPVPLADLEALEVDLNTQLADANSTLSLLVQLFQAPDVVKNNILRSFTEAQLDYVSADMSDGIQQLQLLQPLGDIVNQINNVDNAIIYRTDLNQVLVDLGIVNADITQNETDLAQVQADLADERPLEDVQADLDQVNNDINGVRDDLTILGIQTDRVTFRFLFDQLTLQFGVIDHFVFKYNWGFNLEGGDDPLGGGSRIIDLDTFDEDYYDVTVLHWGKNLENDLPLSNENIQAIEAFIERQPFQDRVYIREAFEKAIEKRDESLQIYNVLDDTGGSGPLIKGLPTTFPGLRAEKAILDGKLDDLSDERDTLQQEYNHIISLINQEGQLVETLSGLYDQRSDLQSDQTSLEGLLAELGYLNQTLLQLNGIRLGLLNVQGNILSTQNDTLTNLSADYDKLQNTIIPDISDNLESVESDISDLESTLDSASGQLNNQYQILNKDIPSVQADYNNAQTDYNDLLGIVVGASSVIGNEIEIMNGAKGVLQNDQALVQADLTALEGEIDDVLGLLTAEETLLASGLAAWQTNEQNLQTERSTLLGVLGNGEDLVPGELTQLYQNRGTQIGIIEGIQTDQFNLQGVVDNILQILPGELNIQPAIYCVTVPQ